MAAEERASLPAPSAASTLPAPAVGGKMKKSSKQLLSAAALSATLGRIDVLLALLVVVFTFVSAAFPVNNTDFYQFLAVGRLIVQGRYGFGEDPFTFTSQGVYWANHSWLFDVGLYALYSLPNGAAVVVAVKAALLSVLGIVMLATARTPRTSLWLPACCVGLAILAASPRFVLQPACLSMLLLALTVWLLRRPLAVEGASLRSWWLLPPLCVLWVNVDQWFLLGPLVVGLFLLGSYLQRRFGPMTEGSEIPSAVALRSLTFVFLGCLAACLVSPHHYHALSLPEAMGFSDAAEILAEDPQFRSLFATPWDIPNGVYYNQTLGLSSAGLAYFPVLLLCIVSFLANRPGFRWWRALLTAALAVVSAVHGRAIPFFVIVAGPVTALNFVDFTTRHYGALEAWNENQRRWALAGRVLTALFGILLVVAAWPGWLQAKPTEQRRVGFDVVTDESLRQAAERLGTLKKEGRLPDTAYFNTSPEIVHYFAWFGHDMRGFADQRLSLYGGAAEDYQKVRKGLSSFMTTKEEEKTPWRAIFSKRKVRLVVFHSSNLAARSPDVMQVITMGANPEEWTPLFLEGGTAVFAWNDPSEKRSPEISDLAINLQAEAYGPKARQAPPKRSTTEPEIQAWYEGLWRPQPRHSADADDAQLHYFYYEAQAQANLRLAMKAQIRHDAVLRASLVANLAMPDPFALRCNMMSYVRRESVGVPEGDTTACLYLALRSARRALAHNPSDARTHLLLGHIYYLLYTEVHEGVDVRSAELLGRIRRSAAAAHLRQAVELDPDLTVGHSLLFSLYGRLQMQDLALKHLGEFRRCLEREGPQPGEKPEDFGKRMDKLNRDYGDMEKHLASVKSIYNINAPGSEPPEKRARLAYREVAGQGDDALMAGLAETALTAYQEVKIENMSPLEQAEVVQQWIDLLFDMGRLAEVRDGLNPKLKELLGIHHRLLLPAYDWFEARLAAASGDYDEAIDDFTRMARKHAAAILPVKARPTADEVFVTQAGLIFGQALLQDTGRILSFHLPADVINLYLPLQRSPLFPARNPLLDYTFRGPDGRQRVIQGLLTQSIVQAASQRQLTAQLQILPGWIALEAGQNDKAEKLLEQALFERHLVERGVGRVVALPLALLALSNPVTRPVTYLAVELASQERTFLFDVERLGANGLMRLRYSRMLPSRP